jgi:protein TonB
VETAPAEAAKVEPTEPEPAAAPPVAAEPVIVPPEVLQRVEPSYSAKAVKGLDNPVIALRVLVDQQGKIARVLVQEGIPGSELEGAAISAVLRWRFRPATEDGVPVKAWTNVRFVFQK